MLNSAPLVRNKWDIKFFNFVLLQEKILLVDYDGTDDDVDRQEDDDGSSKEGRAQSRSK